MRSGTIVAILVLLLSTSAGAQDSGGPGGGMAGPTGQRFPLTHSEVEADISGGVARVTVRQHFVNPHQAPVNVEYIYPLPDDAAVTDLRMEIGNRLIEARVARREDAERTYEEAVANGQSATLGSQVRANVFRQRISNLMPGEEIRTELRYVEDLTFEFGSYSFVFPVVAAPCFAPPAEGPGEFLGGGDLPEHTFELTARIDGGTPVRRFRSPSHQIEVAHDGGSRAEVTLSHYDRLPVKDVVLEWDVETDSTQAGVIAHRTEREGHLQLVLMPNEETETTPPLYREIVFVLDCSGSMQGMPLATAKRIVERTLERLGPNDSFRILRFSDEASALSDRPLLPERRNILNALRYLDRLKANGGTQVLSGVQLALAPEPEPGRVRIVHFITDGLVGNEAPVLAELDRLVGATRVFPLGVGSSVNRFLIERMADVGRGAAWYVRQDAPEEDVVAAVGRFVERIQTPVLTDVWIDWAGLPVYDMVPARLPDLFAGQPVTVHARYGGPATGEIALFGSRNGVSVVRRFRVELPRYEPRNPAAPTLWARAKIRELTLEKYAGKRPDIEEEVTEIALAHRLLSQYTAFVAVDRQTVNPDGVSREVVQPAPWPEGVGGVEFQGILWSGTTKPPARVKPVVKVYVPGPTHATFPKIDAVPNLHLSYLQSWQQKDGSWKAGGDLFGPVGVTSLSVLAIATPGHQLGEGIYGKSLSRGLTWLDKAQKLDGLVGVRAGDAWLLDHSLATLAIMDGCVASKWRWGYSRAKRAVRFLVSQQAASGGWAANGVGEGDTLTTAFAALALSRAAAARVKVDPQVLDGALDYLREVTDQATGLVSMSPLDAPICPDGIAIASAVLASLDLGVERKNTPWMTKSAKALLDLPPPVGDRVHPLYLFLSGSALRRMGAESWNRWNAPLNEASRKAMLPTRELDDTGRPVTVGPKGARLGRAAAMALFGMARALRQPSGTVFTLK